MNNRVGQVWRKTTTRNGKKVTSFDAVITSSDEVDIMSEDGPVYGTVHWIVKWDYFNNCAEVIDWYEPDFYEFEHRHGLTRIL